MMKIRICIFLAAVITLPGISNAVLLDITDEQEARGFLQRASAKMFYSYDKLAQTAFTFEENDEDEVTPENPFNILLTAANQSVEIVNESKKFDCTRFTDPELKYAFKIIRKSANKAILDEEKLIEFVKSLVMLEELAIDKDIPTYRNSSIDIAFLPDIQDIFAKSDDPKELEYYWTTWREKNGAWAASHFLNIVKSMKESAKLNDITELEMWLGDYNFIEMKNVMKQIKPLYVQLHAFIRKQLLKKYGELVIKPNGPIPHHLFEQVLAQAWTSGSIIDDIYPHKNLPPYDQILEQNNYDTLKMFKTADRFYQSLGLDPIPNDYWGSHFKMNSDEDEGDCKPTIFDKSPNLYMKYCQKMDFRKFLQAHGYMAEIYYAREKKDLPAYYYDAYDLQYPVGEAVVLSASTPRHLDNIGLITEFRFTEEVKMNRLLRMGIHTLLNVRVYFVHTKVMRNLFAGLVDVTDLNKHYWRLMDRHVGVAPPVDRGSDAYDFPFKFYTELSENKQTSKFMSEVLGYQIYEKLCEISGQYSRSVKSEPINNCDFYGSKEAGDALKKMMRLGSSKPMREVLATIFPEDPSVNAASLIEYYSPMKAWLIEKNREGNANVGWTHSDKKVSIVTNYDHEDE